MGYHMGSRIVSTSIYWSHVVHVPGAVCAYNTSYGNSKCMYDNTRCFFHEWQSFTLLMCVHFDYFCLVPKECVFYEATDGN